MHRIRRISVALVVAGVLGVAAPAAANATALRHHQRRHVLLSARVAARGQVRKLHPHKIRFKITQGGTTVGINEVKSGSVTIADVAQEPEASDEGKGLDFYPIANYAICVVTNKSNPLSQPHPEPADHDLHRQDENVELGARRRHRYRPDPGDHAHLGRGRADELQVAAAGRQERREQRHRKCDRGADEARSRKQSRRDRLPVQLPGRAKAA